MVFFFISLLLASWSPNKDADFILPLDERATGWEGVCALVWGSEGGRTDRFSKGSASSP